MQKYFCQKLKNAWHIVANRYTSIYLQMYHLKFNCTLFHFIGLFIFAKCDCLKKATKILSSSMKNILDSGFKSNVSSIHVFWPRMYLSKFWSNAAKWQGPWNDQRSFCHSILYPNVIVWNLASANLHHSMWPWNLLRSCQIRWLAEKHDSILTLWNSANITPCKGLTNEADVRAL